MEDTPFQSPSPNGDQQIARPVPAARLDLPDLEPARLLWPNTTRAPTP